MQNNNSAESYMKGRNRRKTGSLLVLHTSSNPTGVVQNQRQNLRSYNFRTLSITLSRLCIKVSAGKAFFFWSGFPGVTPERCSVAACLWYAKPIYRRCRRTVASHHNSQPQDTSSVLLLLSPPPEPQHSASLWSCTYAHLCVCVHVQIYGILI